VCVCVCVCVCVFVSIILAYATTFRVALLVKIACAEIV